MNPTVLFILTLVLSRTKVLCFNIGVKNAIVKQGNPSSYFGFSVAQHAVKKGSENPRDYWILVGAPLGQNLQPNTSRSGALFKCPITQKSNDCIQIETDGKRFGDYEYEDTPTFREAPSLFPPGKDEIKEDQWLGVSLKSQRPGGKAVVCAHRYVQSDNLETDHYGKGLCYVLNRELETKQALEPCKGRPTEKLHQQYGFCQVGTSLAVLEDDFAVMGSPGPYTWRGTIFANTLIENVLEGDHTVYKGPLNDNPTPIDKYSYLGMSVAGGSFFDKKVINFVSGAPRALFHGQVFFFHRIKSVEDLSIRLILNGTQFASSFGYEILAVDIDNDGYDELLVAAPFYYGPNEGGAVYLYKNLRNCTQTNCQPSIQFKGKPESRFGFSMASLGDINKDSYNDVAIGAPYEDNGAIYIYLGTKNGLSSEPSQVIRNRVDSRFKTIGYSLSGGIDMDQNDYPDLLVGAYESDAVILYKTRPIIDIGIKVQGREMRNINVKNKGCSEDRATNKTCFSFSTCFTLSKFRLEKPVEIKYEIQEEAKIPRVTFGDEKNVDYITVKDIRHEHCTKKTAYLVEGNGDILSPIKFRVNYKIHDDDGTGPILNKTSEMKFKATFQKDCGEDDKCYSNLVMAVSTPLEKLENGFKLDVGKNKELILDVNVTNHGESAYESKLFVVHPKGLSYIAVHTEKTQSNNVICTANNESTLVTCNLGNPFEGNQSLNFHLRFEVTHSKDPLVQLHVFVNSTSHELSKQTSQNMTFILQKIINYVIKGNGRPQNIFYSGEVKGQSAMKHLEDIGRRVVHTYDLINQGDWALQNVLVEIDWPYQVYTERAEGGKWIFYLEDVPMVISDSNKIEKCRVDKDIVNPLKLQSSGVGDESQSDNEVPDYANANVRRKRDVDDVVKAETLIGADHKERHIVAMGCQRKTALCAKIKCDISKLNEHSNAQINISARVWESTFGEDYKHVDWVSIKSSATVTVADTSVITDSGTLTSAFIETNAYPEIVLTETGVNIWIIVGSVLAGLLLLIIVIVVLYKCGFFKRNRVTDRTLSANYQKQGESETLLKEGAAAKPTKK